MTADDIGVVGGHALTVARTGKNEHRRQAVSEAQPVGGSSPFAAAQGASRDNKIFGSQAR
ncbi:hypothetical protein ASE06_15740 [Sphingopyxis sp. Root214]|uniref:hypothetical protein n=1 Tax=Sphingopyxis sp. Root154 TaxID=1736476 RepID=UPI0006F3EFAD|nr:hypothetical protein [Sphingopyxis sp. Root154]KQZ73788.1 hypothetical protein ASD73_13395 [Sphingopyxis sp. Root154]KRC07929.1 hypothetical protein ASE06_15740 [Sphingopyxis sp. Root214]